MALPLSLAAALIIGTGDFLGGFAGRRGNVIAVVVLAFAIGVPIGFVIAPLLQSSPSTSDLAWGAAAGVANVTGVFFLYRGLSRGRMAVVSPTAAVGGAIGAVLFGFAVGERPGWLAVAGILVGLTAVALVSRPDREQRGSVERSGLGDALLAAVGFAAMFVTLSRVEEAAGIWPLIPTRGLGAILLLSVALARGATLRPARGSVLPALAAGSFAMLGNAAFLLAVQRGLLTLVSVVTSLYPAVTVVLAALVVREALSTHRLAGLALALVSVGLIAAA